MTPGLCGTNNGGLKVVGHKGDCEVIVSGSGAYSVGSRFPRSVEPRWYLLQVPRDKYNDVWEFYTSTSVPKSMY